MALQFSDLDVSPFESFKSSSEGPALYSVVLDRTEFQQASGLPFKTDFSYDSLSRNTVRLALKRAMDITFSGLALLALLPLLVLVAIAVKATSAGPIFFTQQRPGLNNKPFPLFKFRTMYAAMGDKSGIKQTVSNDPRITPIGNFLRRTSIDELPQLLNILLGQMSLIGPRPHPMKMIAAGMPYEKLVPYYDARTAMKPGLSGWAQMNGYRGPTDLPAKAIGRIEHDIAYIQNFSVLLDIKIIFGTLHREFLKGSGS